MRSTSALSTLQAGIATVALVGITVLGVTDNVSSDALVAIYSTVIGAALGGVTATANGLRTPRGNGE